MNKFVFKNECYWKVLDRIPEGSLEYINPKYAKKSFAEGEKLFVNRKGGYHFGSMEGVTDIHEGEDFPNMSDRKLEDVEFFDLMQAYRMANMSDQETVVRRFENVKKWIRENYE